MTRPLPPGQRLAQQRLPYNETLIFDPHPRFAVLASKWAKNPNKSQQAMAYIAERYSQGQTAKPTSIEIWRHIVKREELIHGSASIHQWSTAFPLAWRRLQDAAQRLIDYHEPLELDLQGAAERLATLQEQIMGTSSPDARDVCEAIILEAALNQQDDQSLTATHIIRALQKQVGNDREWMLVMEMTIRLLTLN